MIKSFWPFALLVVISFSVSGQLTDSNLPIVLISTGGVTIPDAPRILATMKIIYRGEGQRNYVSDQDDLSKLNYNGKIQIEIRGSSSQSLPKKQYGFTTVLQDNQTNNNVSLLSMPEENDWVLNGLAFDASLIRDFLSYNLSRRLGQYAPRQRYCEVIINGSYQGLYILQEKVKVDDNRVDVMKIDPDDNNGEALTGGYLTKADKVTTEDPSAWVMPTYLGTVTDFVHEFPKPDEITGLQHTYIKSVFERLASSANNNSLTGGYPSVIDVPSFVDFMLVNELAANVDAYQFSTFFHKDRNGKLRAGPLWDHNLTFGNDLFMWGLDRSKTNLWQFDNGDNVGPRFWRDLFNNGTFKCYLSKRWHHVTSEGEPMSLEMISQFIDETVDHISEAVVRENARWGTIGNHETHIMGIKTFLTNRIAWMTANFGSFSNCSNVVTPPLVISRIHYHPDTDAQFPDDDDQEFIEIVNNSDATVSTTGYYFSGTGFVYKFPDGAVLPPRAVIQLANNRKTFRQRYGYEPFGEFTRNLSNKSEKITLADAFGNVIDQVEYTDSSPWPDADGNGLHLKLNDPSLDNSIGTNWSAVSELISSNVIIVNTEGEVSQGITVFPNPATSTVTVSSPAIINSVSICDIRGVEITTVQAETMEVVLSLAGFPPGMYFLTVRTGDDKIITRFLKF